MSRGKAWESRMDDILRKWYATEESVKLARQFGYGVRTIERHAAALGLKKDPEFVHELNVRASAAAARWVAGKKARGEKIEKRWGGRGFQKGHRWDEETEARRREAIRRGKRKINLEKYERMSKFAPAELKKMSIHELESLLRVEMDRVLKLRTELDRRKGEKVSCSKAESVNFEEYVNF